jgi:hypothetical protein
MLSPDDRSLLGELLAAPDGFQLTHAVATTFTLDLTALLMVPLGFAGSDLRTDTNQMAVLQAIQEYSDRIDVFCQRGMTKVPMKPNKLLAFLEEMIHLVGPPQSGYLFHPKIWVLRFSPSDSSIVETEKFRLICGSRNLTFDRSWDAAITLDGEVRGRHHAYNNALCDFLGSLPRRAGGLSEKRQGRLTETLDLLNKVEWEKPNGVIDDKDWLKIHIFGAQPSSGPDTSGRRALVISPFLTTEGLMQMDVSDELHVISRGDQLDALDQDGRDFVSDPRPSLFTLDDDAAVWDLEDEESGLRWELAGLHAKVYIIERGHYAHVMIGSANATGPAWAGNDEILIEIVGKKAEYGIDTLIGEKSEFRRILLEHTLGEPPARDPDDDLRLKLERALQNLAGLEFRATIEGSDESGWTQSVRSTQPLDMRLPEAEITVSLATLTEPPRSADASAFLDQTWKLGAITDATPFVAIRLRSGQVEVSTLVLAQIEGGPADRIDRVLASQFTDPKAFLQFIALLLALAGGDGDGTAHEILHGADGSSQAWILNGSGLLELMLRSLSRSPKTLDEVGRLMDRLRETEHGRAAIPDGWDEMWQSVKAAHEIVGE